MTPEERIAKLVGEAKPVRDGLSTRPDLVHVADLDGVDAPARRWCVDQWIPDRQVTLVYGSGGTGKSTLLLQLATACVVGGDFLGIPVSRRRALFVSCEDDKDELHRRQLAVNAATGFDFADFGEGYLWLDRSTAENVMMIFNKQGQGKPTAFTENVVQLAKTYGVQLLIIDTAADVFGGNEIIRTEVRQFMSLMRKVARDIDGAVVILAHPSVAGLRDGGGYSGSTAWHGSARSLLTFEHDDDDDPNPDVRILTRRKANYARAGATLTVRYTAGVFHPQHPPVDQLSMLDEVQDEALYLDKLRGLLARGLCPSASRNRNEYAPKLMKVTFPRELAEVTTGRLEAAQKRLLETGKIRCKRTRENTSPLCPEDYDIKEFKRP
jgi:RecA-family ATPase